VSWVFLEAVIEGIPTPLDNFCAGLTFNFDEIGINEWEDRLKGK
jgi:hypothetical protein